MKHELSAANAAVRTHRAGDFRFVIARTQCSRRLAHCLAARAIAAGRDLLHHWPAGQKLFQHSGMLMRGAIILSSISWLPPLGGRERSCDDERSRLRHDD